MTDPANELLSERLRPRRLADLTLPQNSIRKLERMVERKAPLNMAFRGPPGTGKTSAARIFLDRYEYHDKLIIDGAKETGVNYVRDIVAGFAVSPFRTEDIRICFIDEADHLSSNAQAALRVLIERTSHSCRFILAFNDAAKMATPLLSRLHVVDFTVRQANLLEVRDRLQTWYSERLTELGIPFDRKVLDMIVTSYCPDFRRIANALHFEFGT